MLSPYGLTCEYLINPVGLDVPRPRLSWKSRAAGRGARQSAYQIVVADAPFDREGKLLWDTGKVSSDASVHIPYEGEPLRPGQRCFWRVRVWDGEGTPSEWSETAFWEMGLLDEANWKAEWITPDWDEDTTRPQPGPILRRSFEVQGEVAWARLYATSLGLYELRLNGERVGDAYFTPGWTSYDHRVLYQTYDVAPLLRQGENALGALLGDGWYRGYLTWAWKRNLYGDRLALRAQLHIGYADGRVEVLGTDSSWRAARGPMEMSDIYLGEVYDARKEPPGWDAPGFDDRAWSGVRALRDVKARLQGYPGPLVKKHERLKPVSLTRSPKGEWILDFGQNLVGWVEVRAKGEAGSAVALRHAEVLDKEGNLYTANLRKATQSDRYVLRGTGEEELFEPHFTFHGFRYVAVDEYPGEPQADAFTAVVLHSEVPETGEFSCSDPLVNQLQKNIVWSLKGNFLDVPTDCPQRDERLGWTGDAQVFIRTAAFNRGVGGFFTKWLEDLRLDQRPDGNVPFVIPDALDRARPRNLSAYAGSAAWGDAAVICPWTLYLCYGDTRILEAQFDSMRAWVDYVWSQADEDGICRSGFHWGDWFDYRGEWDRIPAPVTNVELIATAFLAYSSRLLSQAARVLGRQEEAARYGELSERVREAFVREFLTPAGRVGSGTQTSYVLALHFDLLPEPARAEAARRLAEEVRRAGYHLTTGFVGTPYLCHALSRFGQADVAYALLTQETYPSWLYEVKLGATTIWERWNAIKPDGEFQDPGCNSFNHYAYGAIGEWLYRVVAGIEIDPEEPGYKHVIFQPQPGGGLTHARAAIDSPYGRVASAWELAGGELRLRLELPANTRGTLRLAGVPAERVKEGGAPLSGREGIASARTEQGGCVIEFGAGVYEFTAPWIS